MPDGSDRSHEDPYPAGDEPAGDPSDLPGASSTEPVMGEQPAEAGASGAAPAAAPSRSFLHNVWRFIRELVVLVVISVAIAALIKAFLFQVFYIPSGSMEQTLLIGDRVAVDKVSYRFRDVERGDVIVFEGPESWVSNEPDTSSGPLEAVADWLRSLVGLPTDQRDFVKRAVALGGDTVECCDEQGRIMVNGESITEPYVYDNTPLERRDFGPVQVPEGRIFVLGDHRALSADSRFHIDDGEFGTVPESHVIGRSFAVIWPLSRLQRVQSGADSFATVPDAPPTPAVESSPSP